MEKQALEALKSIMAQLPERCFFHTIVVVVHNAFVNTELKIEITKYEINSFSLKESLSTKGLWVRQRHF